MKKPHTLSLMDEDLGRLRTAVVEMGHKVGEAIQSAAQALETHDEATARLVIEADNAIDAAEQHINAQVVRVLALRQPVADDLRAVVAVMKVAGDLERIGDYAKNMARRVHALTIADEVKGAPASLRRQAREVATMLEDALKAFSTEDAELAEAVIAHDVEIDDMTNALFREFVTHMMEDPRKITACLHYAFIAKNTERMGDLVTDVVEQVLFLVTGRYPDDRPRGASTVDFSGPKSSSAVDPA